MSNQQNQSSFEQKWTQVFIDYINQENNTDYIYAKPNQIAGWADIDAEATSPSKKSPQLFIQLTRDSRLDRVVKVGKYQTPVFNSDNIWTAISEKEQKYLKQGKDFTKIILLVQGTMSESSVPFEFTQSLFDNCLKSSFKGIYYLSAPRMVGFKGDNHFEDWLIKELKCGV